MAWSKQHKEQSREKIVESAAILFSHNGFDAISIDDVMQHAGLTRGAFYAHFKNKAELYKYAIVAGAQKAKNSLENQSGNLTSLAQHYLNLGGQKQADSFCPLAFFASDIAQRDGDIRKAYTAALHGYINYIEAMGLSREKATLATVMMIGGLALSRAITDQKLIDQIQHCCETSVGQLSQ